jgi:hypothetical protein
MRNDVECAFCLVAGGGHGKPAPVALLAIWLVLAWRRINGHRSSGLATLEAPKSQAKPARACDTRSSGRSLRHYVQRMKVVRQSFVAFIRQAACGQAASRESAGTNPASPGRNAPRSRGSYTDAGRSKPDSTSSAALTPAIGGGAVLGVSGLLTLEPTSSAGLLTL